MTRDEKTEFINEIIGFWGRQISASKKAPKDHICVFNSNLCVKEGKIWFGDIDTTKDEKKLQYIADTFQEPIYILKEMDGRFSNEERPLLDKAVRVFYPQKNNI